MYLTGYNLSRRAAYRSHSALGAERGPSAATAKRVAQHGHDRSHQKYRPDAGEPALAPKPVAAAPVARRRCTAKSAAACTAAHRGPVHPSNEAWQTDREQKGSRRINPPPERVTVQIKCTVKRHKSFHTDRVSEAKPGCPITLKRGKRTS